MGTSVYIQRRWVLCVGCALSMILTVSSITLAEPPEVRISIDRESLNEMLSHLHGSTFTHTWDNVPFKPTLSLSIDKAIILSINQSASTVKINIKGKVKLLYYILDTVQHSSLGFTAEMQTQPVSTSTAILLQVVDAEILLDDPPIPGTIELLPIEDLVRAVLFPEHIPLLNLQDIQKIAMPLPGKSPITIRPTTPRIYVGKDRLVLFMTLQIESSP